MKHLLLFLTTVFLLSALTVMGQIPQTISYQGVLTDNNGSTVANGDYAILFNLYDVSAAGSPLWTETQTVTISDGIFNVKLGAVNPLNLPFDQAYWLGISIDSGSELAPRIELTSSAYSLRSHSVADSSITTASVAAGQIVRSINALKDDVIVTGKDNILVSQNGDSLIISATGVGNGDITSVRAGIGLTGGGPTGDVILNVAAGNGIAIVDNSVSLNQEYTDKYYVNDGEANSVTSAMITDAAVGSADLANNAVTAAKISPNIVSSIAGVSNDGGNVDFVAGSNMTITPDDANKQITFSSTANNLWNLNGSNISYNSGNVGIGTASPSAALHVNGDYYGKGHLFFHAFQGNGLSGTAYIQARDLSGSSDIDMQFRTQNAGVIVEALKITKEGNVGIGTTAPTRPLQVITTGLHGQHVRVDRSSTSTSLSEGILVQSFSTATGSSQTLGITSYASSDFSTGNVYGLRGTAAGNGPGSKIGVFALAAGNGPKWAVYANGDVYTTGQYYPSDQKLKKDVQKLSLMLPKLMQLDVKSFIYKTDDPQYKHMNLPDKKQYGLIAQAVEKIFPELVKDVIHPAEIDENGNAIGPEINSKSINYTAFIPMLLQAIQELQKRVVELEQR